MSRIFIFGDLHGLPSSFNSLVQHYIADPQPDDIIICAGDVGLEYGYQVKGNLKKAMRKFPGTIYAMRGNHDNRYWEHHIATNNDGSFDYKDIDDGWAYYNYEGDTPQLLYQKKYPNIKYIRDDGGIYRIGEYNFLFIPGAYSVDKYYRLCNNWPYEPHEQLTYAEQLQLLNKIEEFIQYNKIDYVISHTSPLCLEPYYKYLFMDCIDQSKVDKNMEKFLDEIVSTIGLDGFKKWYFGHFHDDLTIHNKYYMIYTTVQEIGENSE